MTTEERLTRIEHLTVGVAEERHKDRDEYKALWRDTQRQINEVSARLVQLSETVGALAQESRAAAQESRDADRRLGERIAETDARLGERIEAMVSAIGEFIRAYRPPTA